MFDRVVQMIGGPADGLEWGVPKDLKVWRTVELDTSPGFYTMATESKPTLRVTKWTMPIRDDNTIHWADRRLDAS